MYWDKVLNEVLNKGDPFYSFFFTYCFQRATKPEKKKLTDNQAKVRRAKMKNYFLGEMYAGVFFTRREAECMVQLLKGKTITKVGATLNLSPRTVEFYLKKMKNKLQCHTKSELIEKVLESTFLKEVDF